MKQRITGVEKRKQRRPTTFLLISLLVHLMLLLLFIFFCFQPHPPLHLTQSQEQEVFIFEEPAQKEVEKPQEPEPIQPDKQEQTQPTPELPALHAQKTNQGFLDGQEQVEEGTTSDALESHTHDLPHEEQQQEEAHPDEPEIPLELTTTKELQPEEYSSQAAKEYVPEIIDQQTAMKPDRITTTQQPEEVIEQNEERQTGTFLDELRIEQLKKEYAHKIKKIKARKKRIKEIIEYDKGVKEQLERIKAQEKAASDLQAPKKKSNILARTKGFIESWSEFAGNDVFSCSGLNKPLTGFEDYKEQYYDALIFWKAQKAWYFHRLYEQLSLAHSVLIVIEGTVDTQGNLLSFNVVKSTGNSKADQLVEESFRKASPFNPIPKHLNQEVHRYASSILIDLHNPKVAWQ